MINHEKQEYVYKFFEDYFLLREINYKLILVCLGLLKNHDKSHEQNINNIKNELSFKSNLNNDGTIPKLLYFLSRIFLSQGFGC